jgi:hypothetical protein
MTNQPPLPPGLVRVGEHLVRVRDLIELEDGDCWSPGEPMSEETLASVERATARHLKTVLRGLGPIFGRERLLALCARIIDEDFHVFGPQTEPSDIEPS